MHNLKQEVCRIQDWNAFGVSAGFTTKKFPLFLRSTRDLLNQTYQEKLKASFPHSDFDGFAFLGQNHSNDIAWLEDPQKHQEQSFHFIPQTDGIFTCIPNFQLFVMTADCLPLFFYAKKKQTPPWVGLIHAGWRGSQKQIAKMAFQTLVQKIGGAVEDINVIMGPCIQKDHYAVGEEFSAYFPKQALDIVGEELRFDLPKENKRQLLEAGALEKNILDLNLCTVCHKEDLYSFRAEKEQAGRIISFISIS